MCPLRLWIMGDDLFVDPGFRPRQWAFLNQPSYRKSPRLPNSPHRLRSFSPDGGRRTKELRRRSILNRVGNNPTTISIRITCKVAT